MKNVLYPQFTDATALTLCKYKQNLHKVAMNYGWGANIVVMNNHDGLLLVDSGYRNTKELLYKYLMQHYSLPVRTIINTHYHADHVGGNSIIQKSGSIYIHSSARRRKAFQFNHIYISKETSITFGDEEITIIPLTDGHSESDMIVFFNKHNIICTGDLYLSESFPLVSIMGNNSAYKVLKNLKQLSTIASNQTTIISGHGRDTNKNDLENYINMVEQSIRLVESLINKGYSKSDIQKADVLKPWNYYHAKIDFITKNSWIENIWRSYQKQVLNQTDLLH